MASNLSTSNESGRGGVASASQPLVSAIIPAYNGADFLADAIQSVLEQSYTRFELIVVDDASPETLGAVVAQFDDPRISFIRHGVNKGANAARNTGFRASSGSIIAFLDQDDIFHPEKLAAHVEYYQTHPDVGFTYNSRYELSYAGDSIRNIWRPPSPLTLEDLVLGFPLSPTDMVISREWMQKLGGWEEAKVFYGGEYVFVGQLALAGCPFGGIERALNYRSFHPGRKTSNLAAKCAAELKCQDRILLDPRCPAPVAAMRPQAHKNTYLVWAALAFEQNETELGQDYLRMAVELVPAVIEGAPCELVRWLAYSSIADETQDHATWLATIVAQLPSEYAILKQQYGWAVAWGYLQRATLASIWQPAISSEAIFVHASEAGAQIDDDYLQSLGYQLMLYENEYGYQAAEEALDRISAPLAKLGSKAALRKLRALRSIHQAFRSYRDLKHGVVPRHVMTAALNDPKYLLNRGVLSIFLRSSLTPRVPSQ